MNKLDKITHWERQIDFLLEELNYPTTDEESEEIYSALREARRELRKAEKEYNLGA